MTSLCWMSKKDQSISGKPVIRIMDTGEPYPGVNRLLDAFLRAPTGVFALILVDRQRVIEEGVRCNESGQL